MPFRDWKIQMMKALKWIVLSTVGVVVIALSIVWINLNSIVRSTVEKQSAASLALPTKVGGATVSIFGGSFSLSDFAIGSPPDFKAPNMMTLGKAAVNVSLSQLRQQPIRISAITIDQPRVVIEANGTKFNFQVLMDRPSTTPTEPKNGQPAEPVKVIIDELTVSNAAVALRPGISIPGLKEEYDVTVPSLVLKNVGSGEGSTNGAAIKDVVVQVLTALAGEASKSSNLPGQLQDLLKLNVDNVKQQVGQQIDKQLGDLKQKLPGDLGKQLDAKSIDQGVQGLLGGGKKEKKKKADATTKD